MASFRIKGLCLLCSGTHGFAVRCNEGDWKEPMRDCSGRVLRHPCGMTGHLSVGQSPFLIHGKMRTEPEPTVLVKFRFREAFGG